MYNGTLGGLKPDKPPPWNMLFYKQFFVKLAANGVDGEVVWRQTGNVLRIQHEQHYKDKQAENFVRKRERELIFNMLVDFSQWRLQNSSGMRTWGH